MYNIREGGSGTQNCKPITPQEKEEERKLKWFELAEKRVLH